MTIKSEDLALITDLYELTMAQSYFQEGHNDQATFSLFIRKYPANRGFFVSYGLEDVLRYLEGFGFSGEAVDRLHRTGIFSSEFLDYLKRLRFTGTIARRTVLAVTANKIAEERDREQERLASLGAAAATLVHEIANPLTAISGTIQNLQMQIHQDDTEAARSPSSDSAMQ